MLDVSQVKEKANEDAASELRLCLGHFEVLFVLLSLLPSSKKKIRNMWLQLKLESYKYFRLEQIFQSYQSRGINKGKTPAGV